MVYQQKHTPNLAVGARRGYCLGFIDDAGNAPNRTPNARTALNNEIRAGRLRTDAPPVGLWVVGFLDLLSGSYAADDHVFFMKDLGNGTYDIRDSETNSGARGPYPNIMALLAWFGNYSPQFVGWSTHCDGRQYVEKVKEGEEMSNMVDETTCRWIIEQATGRGPVGTELADRVGKVTPAYVISEYVNAPVGRAFREQRAAAWDAMTKKVADLEAQLGNSKSDATELAPGKYLVK